MPTAASLRSSTACITTLPPCEPVDFLCSDSALRFACVIFVEGIVDSRSTASRGDACLTPDLNE